METFAFDQNGNEVFRDLGTWVWRATSKIASALRRRSLRTHPEPLPPTHFPIFPIYRPPNGTALIYIHAQLSLFETCCKSGFPFKQLKKKYRLSATA
jgi:hypothetical protein